MKKLFLIIILCISLFACSKKTAEENAYKKCVTHHTKEHMKNLGHLSMARRTEVAKKCRE